MSAMSEVSVRALTKSFRGRPAPVLAGVDFDLPAGEMLVLLGPSGCGKTTTLRCLAGLENPDSGSIRFGQQDIFDQHKKISVPTHRRDIGLVFQSFALWPHLTVRKNIEYPLRSRRRAAKTRGPAVDAAVSMVELPPELLQKRPYQLSGGQQQRVSLARALVAEPAVVLFDEPLSSLDAQLRVQVRSELHKLHRRLGFTGVYVTHDLSEALALGTQVAVMGGGRIKQLAPPAQIFDQPNSGLVARLFGYAKIQFDSSAGGATLEQTSVPAWVRPDRLRVVADGARPAPGTAHASGLMVSDITYLGTSLEVSIAIGSRTVRLPIPVGERATLAQPGAVVALEVDIADIHVLPDDPEDLGDPVDGADAGNPDSSGDIDEVDNLTAVADPAATAGESADPDALSEGQTASSTTVSRGALQ